MELCILPTKKEIIKEIYTNNNCDELLNSIDLLLNEGYEGQIFSLKNSNYILKKYFSFKLRDDFTMQEISINNYISLSIELYHRIIYEIFGTIKIRFDISEYLDIKDLLTLIIENSDDKDLENIIDNNNIFYNKGDSEYIIGKIASKIYSMGLCINYLKTGDIKKCIDKVYYDSYTQSVSFYFNTYLCVERADGDLNSYLKNYINSMDDEYFDKVIRSVLFQTIFGIVCLHEYCSVTHNDIYPRNILYNMIKKTTEYRSELIKYADYFYYKINGKKYNIPYCDIIVKIGDFGRSNKFSDDNVFSNFMEHLHNKKIYYSHITDIMMFLIGFYKFFSKITFESEIIIIWKDIFYNLIFEYFNNNFKDYDLDNENPIEDIENIIVYRIGRDKSKVKSRHLLKRLYPLLKYEKSDIEHGVCLGKII